MNKAELLKRQQMLSAVPTDEADDFEDIILSSAPGVDKEKVVHLPISKTVEYSDEDFERATGRPQPFKVYTEDRMESLCKSIADIGVIDPITVRPLPDGTYQVLAGRHRRKASIRIGAETIPAIIRSDISDYQAAMIMLDTNLERRAELSYSEKAYAYKMRMDLQHSRGRRTDLEGGKKVDTLGELGKENKESRRTVAYLIRLTYLTLPLLEMVDEGTLGFKVAVAISYLSQETQEKLYEEIILPGEKVKQSQIQELKVLETYGAVSSESLQAVFRKPVKAKVPPITIRSDILTDYADILPNSDEVEKLFIEFLQNYRCSLKQA
ncbi:MAG: ParB/RepB/Spo0J family partition protein [Oscillospiraceae bacterium]|nr:ParB/RepB/Spo0J family partition protein [Oscillospiraceae bacterium]